jgi:ABC-type multidrug transport system ATPase subunit
VSDIVVRAGALRKSYGRIVAVDALDLEVPRGAVFGLLGPNGAGKSTTFGVLCGWLRADRGEATVLGVPSQRLWQLRGKVGAMPQDAAFPPQLSVHRQLTHLAVLAGQSTDEAERDATRVLTVVGLGDAAHKKGNELSHGMHKRVGLAQALLGSPEVLFLDEPTSGLDPASARQVKDLIASLAPSATVIVSSHNLAELQEICTHGAILDRGKRMAYGTIAELTKQGTQVTFELSPKQPPPMDKLAATFGAGAVRLSGTLLEVVCKSDDDVAEVISRALRILLDHGTQVLGLKRGTSLERAYLEVTKKSG